MKMRISYVTFLLSLLFLQSVYAACEKEGALALITVPTEAEIYVDGQLKVNMTPVVIKLSPGEHHIKVVAAGKQPQTLDIFMTEGVVLSPKKIVLVDLPSSPKTSSPTKLETSEPKLKQPRSKEIVAKRDKGETDSKSQQSPQKESEQVTEKPVTQPKPEPKSFNQAGIAYLEKSNYDMIKEVLPLRIEWQEKWQKQAQKLGLSEFAQITAKREEVLALWKEGDKKPVFLYVENVEDQVKARKAVLRGIKSEWIIKALPAKSDHPAIPLTTKLYKTLQGHSGDVNSVSFSPDGRFLASGSNDNTVKLWKINIDKKLAFKEWKTLRGHEGDVTKVTFISNTILASADNDDTILRWEIKSGKKSLIRPQNEVINSVAFSPNGHIIAGSSDYSITMWEIITGKILFPIEKENKTVSMIFSVDGNILASGNNSSTITLWKVNNGDKLQTLKGFESTINTLAFSPDKRIFVAGGTWDEILLWDVNTGKLLNTLQPWSYLGSDVLSIAFRPDGRILASGSGDETITLWEVHTGMKLETLQGDGDDVRSVAFSPDGRILASGDDDNTVKIWIP
ncbi:WD40 repeat domain-containing protein [Candidatus Parabeggiatoa sp. HSG14]|uniref:WD40 repeat domain-containing protein n=1 Tax=Candidatus Parabeggiatoa sp. HSG14 TaxID=3055593 RepID=UPI0025A8B705|nr:WD40 repeat domain-containing protein [Thiotrichales bacterium HSG14]